MSATDATLTEVQRQMDTLYPSVQFELRDSECGHGKFISGQPLAALAPDWALFYIPDAAGGPMALLQLRSGGQELQKAVPVLRDADAAAISEAMLSLYTELAVAELAFQQRDTAHTAP